MSHQNVVRVCAQVRRLSAVVSTAVLMIVLGVFSAGASAASTETPGKTFPVSVTAAGEFANGEGTGEYTPVSISDDGRYVAFESAATNLGAQGPAGTSQGFVKDLSTGTLALATRADGVDGEPAGEPGIGNLALSGDGRYVIFTSAATNLGTALPGEEPSERHVYRRDLESGETSLVDRVDGADGQILSRGAEAVAVSADGRYVAFVAQVENLEDPTGDHTETANAVGYVRDMEAGTTVAVSRASGADGEVGDEPAEGLSISADGRYAAFSSRATNLVPGMEANIWEQVYLRDLQTATTTLISRNALGEAGDRSSVFPRLSGEDGCKVAFSSIAFNLLQPSPLNISGEQVYVADHCASPATMALVSQSASADFAPFAYTLAGTSGDGRYALFAAEFIGSPCCHLYLRDLEAGQTSQLDRASGAGGASANENVETFAISANGCRVVFTTRATNLYDSSPPNSGGEEPWQAYVRQLARCVEAPEESEAEDPGSGAGPGSQPGGEADKPGSSSSDNAPVALPTPLPATLKIGALGRRRLLLDFSAAGSASVKIKRQMQSRHWKLVRKLVAETSAAGRVRVDLPKLPPGRYRIEVRLLGAQARARWASLTVALRRPAGSRQAPAPSPAGRRRDRR